MSTDWLQNLRAGDHVIVGFSTFGCDVVRCVGRTTSTQIILDNGMRFNKQGGRLLGGGKWKRVLLREGTPEAISRVRDAAEHRALVKAMRDMDWEEMSLAELRAVTKLLSGSKLHSEAERGASA